VFPVELGRFIYWVPVLEFLKIYAQNLHKYHSVLYNFFQVIDVVDLTPILRENILHANFCFLRK